MQSVSRRLPSERSYKLRCKQGADSYIMPTDWGALVWLISSWGAPLFRAWGTDATLFPSLVLFCIWYVVSAMFYLLDGGQCFCILDIYRAEYIIEDQNKLFIVKSLSVDAYEGVARSYSQSSHHNNTDLFS